ncbi:PIN domain-containing protein [Candidatus Micrarchaeota archaeon]|nr:PIN domain-containing protein [Candidatus Micrarchaeota archaeon]
MTSYLIDSYGWIEYFEGSSSGKKVKEILESSECFTSSLSIAEVTNKLLKKGKDAEEGYGIMKSLSKELFVDHEISFETGKLYFEKRKRIKDIGIVDIFIMIHARQENLIIVTGDREHFKDENNVFLI